jgi:dolichol-phosphate mannosyltransferase
VLPCLDEQASVEALLDRLVPVLGSAARDAWEVIFVDDGSTDGTPEILAARSARDPRIKLISLSRNFGHQAALSAGLDAASGDAVVLMDCDGQDPPEVIPELVARWRAGADVVVAVRRSRTESFARRTAYALFYRLLRALAEIEIPLDAGDFSLLDRRAVEEIRALPERNRFLRGLRAWIGFRQEQVEYDRAARLSGDSKYTLRKLVRLALSGFLGFSLVPLRLAVWLGLGTAATGGLLGLYVLASYLFRSTTPRGWTSLAAIILFLGGVQLIVTGVIGEYLGRAYDEVRQRPLYIVRRRVGFGEAIRKAGVGGAAERP